VLANVAIMTTMMADLTSITDEKLAPAPEWTEDEDTVEMKDRSHAQVQIEEEDTYRTFQEDTNRLLHAVKVEKAACHHLDETSGALLKEVEENTHEGIKGIWMERHAIETGMERLVDEKVDECRGLLAGENGLQVESAKYTREIGDEVCHLYSDIEQARRFRMEKGEKLVQAVQYKLDEIDSAITAEQRIRLESESTLLELFGQMGQKIEKELSNSREERHAATNRIICFLEDILPQLEVARLFRTVNTEETNKMNAWLKEVKGGERHRKGIVGNQAEAVGVAARESVLKTGAHA